MNTRRTPTGPSSPSQQRNPSKTVALATIAVLGAAVGTPGCKDSASSLVPDVAVVQVMAGSFHSCALTGSGAAFCWGANFSGSLGNGSLAHSSVPVAVQGGLAFTSIAAGGNRTCAVAVSGSAYCWGDNTYGALGNGTDTSSAVPVEVSGGLRFVAVTSGGAFHSCGLTVSGTSYCWGDNTYGQLGDGSTTDSWTPVAVSGHLAFKSIGAGVGFTCALTHDDAAYCWGINQSGQLGIGSLSLTTVSPTPVAVSGGLAFSTVTNGYSHACGLTKSGEAYCWGSNLWLELGVGTSTGLTYCGYGTSPPRQSTDYCSTVPIAVATPLRWASIDGGVHSCALTPDGTGYCWGDNFFGALGDGTTEPRTAPVAVSGGLAFSALSAGSDHTCGLTKSGVLYCWGWNAYGQLGQGTQVGSPVPVAVLPF